MHDHRSGAKQPHPFDPARAALLDDRSRFEYLPPAALIALLDLNVADTLVDFGTGTGTVRNRDRARSTGCASSRP